MCQTALTGRRNSVPAASGEERPVLTWRDLKHRTLKPASGGHRPVQCRFATFSTHESGGHRTRPVPHKERPVTPRRAHKARAQGHLVEVFSIFFPSPEPHNSSSVPLLVAAAGIWLLRRSRSFSLAPDLLQRLSSPSSRVDPKSRENF